jgi:hypothetical protein
MNAHIEIVATELKDSGFRVRVLTSTCVEASLKRGVSIMEVQTALEDAMGFDPATDYTQTASGSVLVHVDLE